MMQTKGLCTKPGVCTRELGLRFASPENRKYSKRCVSKARRRQERCEIEEGLYGEAPRLYEWRDLHNFWPTKGKKVWMNLRGSDDYRGHTRAARAADYLEYCDKRTRLAGYCVTRDYDPADDERDSLIIDEIYADWQRRTIEDVRRIRDEEDVYEAFFATRGANYGDLGEDDWDAYDDFNWGDAFELTLDLKGPEAKDAFLLGAVQPPRETEEVYDAEEIYESFEEELTRPRDEPAKDLKELWLRNGLKV